MPVCNLNYTNDKGIHGDEDMCDNKLLASTQWEIYISAKITRLGEIICGSGG